MEDLESADVVDELEKVEPDVEVEPELDDEGNPIEAEDLSWADEGDEPDPSDAIPPGAMKKKRHQLRAARADLADEKGENEKLRSRIAELENANPVNEAPKRPLRSECEDDDEYDEKYDAYRDEKDAFDRSTAAQSNGKKEAQATQQREIADDAAGHYVRAEKFIKAHANITPEIYTAADAKVREIAESVHGAAGDAVIDMLISAIGEGSEKVMLHIGRNKASMARFASLMASDKSGLKVVSFLSDKKNEINGSKNKTSQAPKPAANASGNANAVPAKDGAWKKKYDKAHKSGNAQEAFDIKSEAKKAGITTRNW